MKCSTNNPTAKNILQEWNTYQTRRQLFTQGRNVLGGAALASLLGESLGYASPSAQTPHFPAKAKRVIFFFMAGGPSHVDTFDWKPELTKAGLVIESVL